MGSRNVSPDAPTEFLSCPSAADADGQALSAGNTFGAYIIHRMLGEGGMGRVYLAEQTRPVRREVALKLIRDQIASPLARAWFEVERQALAQMRHPAIAQVLDTGTTPDGRAWFAMELVDGVPLTQFCEQQQLSLDRRLKLFERICHGVQHAHQKGIIHRDLKPANVLVQEVDGVPTPKIIDFGIAIGGDGDRHPAADTSDAAGTGVYMSPEQTLNGSIDTRSDVYSLGVMLYEILSNTDPGTLTSNAHRSAKSPQKTLLDAISGGMDKRSDPHAMLSAARRLPHELRCVLRKALAEDRELRYTSSSALADDLQRFRERRPLSATPQTRRYLVRCFLARHRLGLTAATIAFVALAAGTALAVNGLLRARHAASVAQLEAEKATQISAFVREMLSGIDPDRARSMDRKLMRMVLDSAAERASSQLGNQPAVRAEIERTIADSYASLGETELAGTHFVATIEAMRAAREPDAAVARVVIRNAENIDNLGKPAEALEYGREALALVSTLPADHRDRLHVEAHFAGLEADAGRLEDSRTRYMHVLAAQRRLFGDTDPDTLDATEGLAGTTSTMARYDEARPLYERLIDSRRARYGAEHSKTLAAINGLAILELEQKHFAQAEALLTSILPIAERVLGNNHAATIRFVSNLGGAIRQQGRNEEARPYYQRTYDYSLRTYGPEAFQTIVAESNLSLLLRDAGQLDSALEHARHAANQADATLGDNPVRAIFHKELATILTRLKRWPEAERELSAAWHTFSTAKGYGPEHPRAQEVVAACVDLYRDWGKPQKLVEWESRRTPLQAAGAP